MPEQSAPSAIRRKLDAQTNPLDQDGMSPAKALRVAVLRAAEDAAELEAKLAGFSEEKTTLIDIVQRLEDPYLICLIEGPGGAVGLALWDCQIMSALVEQLITGRVVPSPADPRPPTRTDAAVIAEFMGMMLKVFDDGLAQIGDAPPVSGFRQVGLLEDSRAVTMALEDIDYRHYRLSLDLADGAKTGELQLIFPWNRVMPAASTGAGISRWKTDWRDVVKTTHAPIEAILHRTSMPISEIARLQVGTTILIPAEAIGAMSLEGENRHPVATGRLGQTNGHRAVRVCSMMPLSELKEQLLPDGPAVTGLAQPGAMTPAAPAMQDIDLGAQTMAPGPPDTAGPPDMVSVQTGDTDTGAPDPARAPAEEPAV